MKKLKTVICFAAILFSFTAACYARTNVESLAEVEKLFMAAKYERVVLEATKLIDAGAHGREELFYLKGLSQMQLNRFGNARETLRYMVERYPRGKRAFDGYLSIGDAYFLEGKMPEAVGSYNEALNNYPDNKNISTAYYKMGSAYQRMGNGDKAKEYFDKLKNSSPLSFESKMIPKDKDIVAAPVVNSPAMTKEIPAREADSYYIQTGYFKSKNNAEKLNEKLQRRGYESSVEAVSRFGAFYRVRIGRFKSKAEAESLAIKLRSEGFKTKVCQ